MDQGEPERFEFDVFLSHSKLDKVVVHALAERLQKDGLKVWLDDWQIKLGDSIYAAIARGLERSRILILFMSRNAFASDWATLEHQTVLFRDPLNKARRFIPIHIDDGPIPPILGNFSHLEWRPPDEEAYQILLAACRLARPPTGISPPSRKSGVWEIRSGRPSKRAISKEVPQRGVLEGHTSWVRCVAVTADGRHAVSGAADGKVRVWDLDSGTCSAVLQGHTEMICALAVTPDGRLAVSGSDDWTVRAWDLGTGTCSAVLQGTSSPISEVSVTADGRRAVSGSFDEMVRVWDLDSGTCSAVLQGHSTPTYGVAVTPDGRWAVSGTAGGVVRAWDLGSGTCSAVLRGHTAPIYSMAVTADGRRAVSGSDDRTVRVWDLDTGTCAAVLEGHSSSIYGVAVTADGRRAVSGSEDRTVRAWDLDTGTCAAVLEGHTGAVSDVDVSADGRRAVSSSFDETVRFWDLPPIAADGSRPVGQSFYTNAKVLLTGESGAGKSGLAQRLIYDEFEATHGSDGVWATQLRLPQADPKSNEVEREIWLWDFAGQADYRLIHQLFMDGTDLALLVFDPQKDNPFDGLAQWDNDITRAAGGRPFLKRLVAGRCDLGGLRVSRKQVEEFQARHGFAGYHETSALAGKGCDDLRKAIADSIPWGRLPKTSSPTIFKRIKEEVLKLKDAGRVLLRGAELKQVLTLRMIGESFTPEALHAVVGLLANSGVVWPLDFGGYVLLQPERINSYAGALVRAVRAHSDEIGCVSEADVLAGQFPVPEEVKLEAVDEQVVLRAMVDAFLRRGLCLKEPVGAGSLLVFPAYFRRDRPEQTKHPATYVRYQFAGSLDEIYTTLVVRLHHTDAFDKDQLWKDAADFQTRVTRLRAGMKLQRLPESTGLLTVYLDPKIPIEIKATFMKFVHDHLTDERARRASNVERERFYVCDRCETSFDSSTVRRSIAAGKKDIYCQICDDGHRVLLLDEIEKLFQAPETAERARAWNREAQAVLDSQSLEQILNGHVQAIAGEAGQIWRPTSLLGVGIDGEIEFKDMKGKPSGKKVLLQLKSGNSYYEARKKDGVEIFRIKEDRHADLWQKQSYPVWLVIRTTDERSGSSIRWMEISEYLKRKSIGRKTPVKQIEFQGEPLTAQTLMALRDRMVPPPKDW